MDEKGIEIIAVSTDTPEQIREGRAKHGLRSIQLSDPELVVTDLLNLRNPRNISPLGLGGLPIPTTFLVDGDGTIRWIDQTNDYMLRSQPDRVLEAIRGALS